MKLKTNLHFHTGEDPKDNLPYSFNESIDYAAKLGFEVIAHTCHNKLIDKPEHTAYAAKKNILLINGLELNVEKKHVVVLNPTKEIESVSSFEELEDYKKANPQIFILAPHPYYPLSSLGKNLERFIHLFDAVEHSWFYSKSLNLNKRAESTAKKNNLPLIATSDTHWLETLNKSYALINASSKSIPDIFQAIKNNNFKNITSPLKFFTEFIPWAFKIITP